MDGPEKAEEAENVEGLNLEARKPGRKYLEGRKAGNEMKPCKQRVPWWSAAGEGGLLLLGR
jgi:hypothetical protein